MSTNQKDEASVSSEPDVEESTNAAADEKLSELMASGDAPATKGSPNKAGKRDLDADAMAAAQAAIAEGERALAEARAQLSSGSKAPPKRSRSREVALRLLLAANVLAMLVVMSLPMSPAAKPSPITTPEVMSRPGDAAPVEPRVDPPPAGPRLADKYNQALLASEGRDYARAVELLQEYLVDTPRMPASRLVNVYRAMAEYSSRIGRFREAQDYERRAQAVTQSHSLPEDLVEMAKAALASGDQESLRQVWARFLLQQRQIPSSLYQHVAEAYLQLGDSYRVQANEAAEQARIAELKQADELRQRANDGGSKR